MQSSKSNVSNWATAIMLMRYDYIAEIMLDTSMKTHRNNQPTSTTFGNAQIPFKQSVMNLVLHLTSILL